MAQVVTQSLALYAQLTERQSWHPHAESLHVKEAIAPDTAGDRAFPTASSTLTLTNFTTATPDKPEKSNGRALSPTQNGSN